jgi:hypothetical protein
VRTPIATVAVATALAAGAAGCLGLGSAGTPQGAFMPKAPAPQVATGAPPNAYIEFGGPGRWMVRGSSCWTTTDATGGGTTRCADTIAPEQMPGVPRLTVSRGAVGHIHLGFAATHAELTIGRHPVPVTGTRTLTFTARRAGILTLFVNHAHDDATYVARIVRG